PCFTARNLELPYLHGLLQTACCRPSRSDGESLTMKIRCGSPGFIRPAICLASLSGAPASRATRSPGATNVIVWSKMGRWRGPQKGTNIFEPFVPFCRSRPLMFLYNGGPGSASMWLHMGSIGPPDLGGEFPFG